VSAISNKRFNPKAYSEYKQGISLAKPINIVKMQQALPHFITLPYSPIARQFHIPIAVQANIYENNNIR
jgi:hypothetical protein